MSATDTTDAPAGIGIDARAATMTAWPIPSGQITEGRPDAEGLVFSRSSDRRTLRGVWRCGAGSFTWHFGWDETLVVIEGDATVELDTGERVELRPGVTAFFGRGHDSTWTIREPILKGFHILSPEPLDL
jgi:uncharacterized cupin superfamily protein